ncbi:MAG: DNA repair protein RecN [Alphaproteobacteria bacterium RIFCSPLOWO2_01_FULL_45_8]|nr:MAG: DNA repair protein RecN [Alphaproteobacteria bacterium GWB1_45_5]OFW76788.1 MAG: DNA repair protein RecN [Alphaproteobacteria bacterium GWA1_45_9]OFW89870.1 MAG: DNA repair protein RecN [Alphaproteobacteria bacterium RIFCSPHIGHO2_01_FULL_41_14]OFW96166.1 MAG: DNA repair protein RecN [Alphaproteobacteria bacterium RIFCSPLOWO2_01_FULL_45_8]HCI49007.1 DNA repair protein RecN [Holosporales bacterium]
MLQSITIRNIAVIEKLHIEFEKGFSVLTGETGAGKSILLDSLGFVLGNRQPMKLIREGEAQASVTLVLDSIPSGVESLLENQGFEIDVPLMVRRTVSSDGKSKAFLNDQPIGVTLLNQIAPHLAEIHGQFDQLLKADQQLDALDRYINHSSTDLEQAYHHWKKAETILKTSFHRFSDRINKLEELAFLIQELEHLAPGATEEEDLLTLKKTEKSMEQIQTVLRLIDELSEEPLQLENRILTLQRHLEKLDLTSLSFCKQSVETILLSFRDIRATSHDISLTLRDSVLSLDQIEGRLYLLRQMARKHQVLTEELPSILKKLREEHSELLSSDSSLEQLQQKTLTAKRAYQVAAAHLYTLRQEGGASLAQEIKKALEPLKLPHAVFLVSFEELPEPQWSEKGMHRIEFFISTNPGLSPGPLAKVASGGELSRVMLALKSILKEKANIPTLIFDEIDMGLGGAVAAAMGEQLSRLSTDTQILAITHSPQLAGHADHHFGVEKSVAEGKTTTAIHLLSLPERVEELSRMLSGKTITEHTRAAAQELLKDKVSL